MAFTGLGRGHLVCARLCGPWGVHGCCFWVAPLAAEPCRSHPLSNSRPPSTLIPGLAHSVSVSDCLPSYVLQPGPGRAGSCRFVFPCLPSYVLQGGQGLVSPCLPSAGRKTRLSKRFGQTNLLGQARRGGFVTNETYTVTVTSMTNLAQRVVASAGNFGINGMVSNTGAYFGRSAKKMSKAQQKRDP